MPASLAASQQASLVENWSRQPRHVHTCHALQSLMSSNVLSNRHEMLDFEGLGLDNIELLIAT